MLTADDIREAIEAKDAHLELRTWGMGSADYGAYQRLAAALNKRLETRRGVEAERERRGHTYAHMCRDEHVEIGHNDSESEMCPLCRAISRRDAERERCAKIADRIADPHTVARIMPSVESPIAVAAIASEIAKAIRSGASSDKEQG
jgi:hypothetical protein